MMPGSIKGPGILFLASLWYLRKNRVMAKLSFTSARLESFSRAANKGGIARFSASWNKKVADAMGWTEVPEHYAGADLDGELAATSMELVPNDAQLKKHVMELDLTGVKKFQAVRMELEGKRDKGTRIELRFRCTFVAPGACKMLEQYMLTVGEAKSTLTVSYQKQESLTPEQAEATSAAADTLYQ